MVSITLLLTSVGCTPAPAANPTVEATNTPYVAQDKPTDIPAPVGTTEPNNDLPQAVGTFTYPTPGLTPSRPVPTITPTAAYLERALVVTPSTVSTVTLGLDVDVAVQGVISTGEAVESVAWSPHGDGLIYMTMSGKLYWVDIAGTNHTLLYTYEDAVVGFDILGDQMPLNDVLYLVHLGKQAPERRLPGHMDMLRFLPGQPPIFEEKKDLPVLWSLRWWGPDRASGVLLSSYAYPDGYVGGDRLVTLDAEGSTVEDRNIPYIQGGEIQPGGEWLAYGTSQQATDVPFSSSEPSTGYLLNLHTGERIQVSPTRMGSAGRWSPDGKWFISDGVRSKDGVERIVVPLGLSGVVWNPDSTRLASYSFHGGCEPEGDPPCHPYRTELYVVDLSSKQQTDITELPALKDLGLLARPKWSTDGRSLAAVVLDPLPGGEGAASEPQPRIYIISVSSSKAP